MSFVRVPGQGKRHPVRSRKTSAPKEWVSTVNDLSVHKLTPEEVSRRHELHRSQNRAVAKWELRERALRRRRTHAHPNSPGPLDRASISIIREVFSDNLQLQDVLARSDRAMAVVKDLFGDAPRRHTVVRPLSFHQQTTHPGQSPSPAPSFCSLPCPSTTSLTDHTLQEPNLATQDSMLAQIAELTRQNALIKMSRLKLHLLLLI